MRTAFAYLRVSGLGQVDGFGFDRQLAAVEAYAAANDIKILEVYREEAVTGKNDLDNRPALQRLIVDLLKNGMRLVLIEKLDRLARMLIVQETILQDLTRRGIQMISISEPDLCSDDPTRTLIRQILGAFFEYERKMIVSKLADARQRKRNRGERVEGVIRYGQHPKYPGEKVVLDKIFVLRGSGLNLLSICRELNDSGLRTRSGGEWFPMTVKRILSRE